MYFKVGGLILYSEYITQIWKKREEKLGVKTKKNQYLRVLIWRIKYIFCQFMLCFLR